MQVESIEGKGSKFSFLIYDHASAGENDKNRIEGNCNVSMTENTEDRDTQEAAGNQTLNIVAAGIVEDKES